MTLKLNHLHLKTRDPEKTVKFYVDNLGAKIVNHRDEEVTSDERRVIADSRPVHLREMSEGII